MMHRNAVLGGLLLCVAFVSFVMGSRYQKIVSHKNEYLMFANISGDNVGQVNRILSEIGSKKALEELREFNTMAINDFGCAPWLTYLEGFDDSQLLPFKSAMRSISKEAVSKSDSNVECLSNLVRFVDNS